MDFTFPQKKKQDCFVTPQAENIKNQIVNKTLKSIINQFYV